MRLDLLIGNATQLMTGIDRITIDGVLYAPRETPLPTLSADKLSPLYFSGDDLIAAVARIRPDYEVIADGGKMDGSGSTGPAIYYRTQTKEENPLQYMVLASPEHPYFAAEVPLTREHVTSLVKSAPTVQKVAEAARTSNGAINPADWSTGETTTPPLEMAFLTGLIGPGGTRGVNMMKGFRFWYYRRWGKQASDHGPAPTNHEAISDEELAQIKAMPEATVQALLRGEDAPA